ncbi:MAG: FAD-dependent oxidoreductase [Candidatus Kariarchaeaceae archaeon]|jgi:glutamate synthase (NADPH/NADH) small chain
MSTVKRKRRRNAVKAHTLPVEQRIGNFDEVNLGYRSTDEIFVEVDRCISCRKPKCTEACPAHFDIPAMISALKDGDFPAAAKLVNEFYCIPQSFNRVCPAFCQDACAVGRKGDPIQVLNIKRYLADHFEKTKEFYQVAKPTGKRVAIIGAGPAGLTAAYDLAKLGHSITVFEKTLIGGMLTLGIPEYRLKNELLFAEVKDLEKLGITFEIGKAYGIDFDYDELYRKGFNAILIAHGAHRPKWMNIPGDDLEGSLHAVEFLRDVALGKDPKIGKKVAVVGGGDVAIDAVRVAYRLGSEAFIVYRRSKEEMPATKMEIHETEEEGIPINFLTNPVEIIGENGKIIAVKLLKMELGEPDESGRRRPVPIPDSEYVIEVDNVIQAISQEPEYDIFENEGYILTKWNTFEVDSETMKTNVYGVFAAGDNVSGPKTAVEAIDMAKRAAKSIHNFLLSQEKKEVSIIQH